MVNGLLSKDMATTAFLRDQTIFRSSFGLLFREKIICNITVEDMP